MSYIFFVALITFRGNAVENRKLTKKLKTENGNGKTKPTWSKFTYLGHQMRIVTNIFRGENMEVAYAVKTP